MDMKDKYLLSQNVVPFLGDMRAEFRVSTVAVFDGVSSKRVNDQCIGVSPAISDQMDGLTG